jgi:hypothetical protein
MIPPGPPTPVPESNDMSGIIAARPGTAEELKAYVKGLAPESIGPNKLPEPDAGPPNTRIGCTPGKYWLDLAAWRGRMPFTPSCGRACSLWRGTGAVGAAHLRWRTQLADVRTTGLRGVDGRGALYPDAVIVHTDCRLSPNVVSEIDYCACSLING